MDGSLNAVISRAPVELIKYSIISCISNNKVVLLLLICPIWNPERKKVLRFQILERQCYLTLRMVKKKHRD